MKTNKEVVIRVANNDKIREKKMKFSLSPNKVIQEGIYNN